MSSRARTTKRNAYIGRRWMRKTWWASTRRRARAALRRGETPDPPRHRHEEKWDRE